MPEKELAKFRREIDLIDRKILDLLNQRSGIVITVGNIKKRNNEEIYAPLREKMLLEGLARKNKGPFPTHALRAVFGEILSASRSLQSPIRVAFLGPEATFSHMAALKYFGRSAELVPEGTIAKVFESLEHKRAQCGIVPIENSTEGVVGATLDCFLDSPLKITGEATLPIANHLLGRGSLRSITKIYSHPQPLAQCRNWLEQNLPSVPVVEVESTARAAERAAKEPDTAGIASEHAAEIYGLKFLKRHIEDNPRNMTRFLALGTSCPPRSGHDKTSILFSVKDEPGILYRMLEPFYRRKINLTKIESRPLKKKVWEYIFFVDVDGHCEDKKVREAIRSLEKKCLFLKILGSYPKVT